MSPASIRRLWRILPNLIVPSVILLLVVFYIIGCTDHKNGDSPEVDCNDGIDNDGDGDIDCADSDCGSEPTCDIEEAHCNDGIDNDGDTLVDCDDPDCAGAAGC